MHKRLVNQCVLHITLIPDGPMLIKSGQEGADPTKPDMEFVETYHDGRREIYLPGSSLKGALRSQAERIVLTLGGDTYNDKKPDQLWAEAPAPSRPHLKEKTAPDIYRHSCFTDQMFGNTHIASRIRIEDAYYDPTLKIPLILEERNSVAIDRLSGATANTALFNFEVCTSGAFSTRIWLRNFTLAQLGLMGLVLRDLSDGWFSLGFAKSRGLGVMKQVKLNKAIIQYPTCILNDQQGEKKKGQQRQKKIAMIGRSQKFWRKTDILGASEFLEETKPYGLPDADKQDGYNPKYRPDVTPMSLNFGVQQCWEGQEKVESLFELAVQSWQKKVTA
ncbi:MAG: RAMP superfamily CRISPR-associated protein [Cyanobacteria bacterium P01_H01_bin.21]